MRDAASRQFEVTHGKNIIDILSDGCVTCLKIEKPVAIDWYDNMGSSGKYFACTGTSAALPLVEALNEALRLGNDEKIFALAETFLGLFANGTYNVSIKQASDHELHFEYGHHKSNGSYSYWYYPDKMNNLVFTQGAHTLSEERIAGYIQLIEAGIKPKAILFEAFFEDEIINNDNSISRSSLDSPLFVLDGHHKLMAYHRLGIAPHYMLVNRSSEGQPVFDKHRNSLYFEYEHFLEDAFRQHIISHIPIKLTGKTDKDKNYNRQFDHYLETCRRIETTALQLFEAAYKSGAAEDSAWLIKRLTVVAERNFNESGKELFLNFRDHNAQYGSYWNGMPVKSKKDLDTWMKKMFGETLDELIKKATR